MTTQMAHKPGMTPDGRCPHCDRPVHWVEGPSGPVLRHNPDTQEKRMYLPPMAKFINDQWFANGRVITGDDDYCVSIFDAEGTYEGAARLRHTGHDYEEFQDRVYHLKRYTFSIYSRDPIADGWRMPMTQHHIMLLRGDDGRWRIAPTDRWAERLMFTSTLTINLDSLAESVLALVRAEAIENIHSILHTQERNDA